MTRRCVNDAFFKEPCASTCCNSNRGYLSARCSRTKSSAISLSQPNETVVEVAESDDATDKAGRRFGAGDTFFGYGWYFNTGWTSGTLYFSPRFTAYLERNVLDIANEAALVVGSVCSGVAAALAVAATGALATGVAVALGSWICGTMYADLSGDLRHNIRQAVARTPDGCLKMKIGPIGIFNVDFDDVSRSNKYCTKARGKEG